MQIFYVPDIDDSQARMDPSESHHCIRVLRMKEGELIHCVDGRGGIYTAEIQKADPKGTAIRILDKKEEEILRNYRLHIIIAPTKNTDRFEWFAEKATEIGIDEISPAICEHSERKQLRIDRLEKRMISAMKQSLKARLPVINPLRSFSQCLDAVSNNSQKFIAYVSEDERENLLTASGQGNDLTLLIGPEGDFSENEIKQALETGYRPVSLGESRLRTETAGIAACQIIASRMLLQQKKTGHSSRE